MSERFGEGTAAESVESEGDAIADRLEVLVGAKKEDRLMRNFLSLLRKGGKKSAMTFLWNESDKLRSTPDVIVFCEQEIFDAGASGVEAETPWNGTRRMAAKREKEKTERARVRSHGEYVDSVLAYARSTGWVKEAEIPTLVQEVLEPVFQEYLDIVSLLQEEDAPREDSDDAIARLNGCLESTQRIGSTDKNNILLSISDAKARAQRRSDVAAGAVGNFYATVSKVFERLG